VTVRLDHAIVPARNHRASAELLATLLGVPWSKAGVGSFCPVYVNDGLTLDFDHADGPIAAQHFCFRVSEAEFDRILGKIKARGIAYRSAAWPGRHARRRPQGRPHRVLERARRPSMGSADRQLCTTGALNA
jgi:hypothetical protein